MPNTSTQPGKLSATLVLDDTVTLAGDLSALLDGRLTLEEIEQFSRDA